ncbi:MAG: acetate--CoA ligase [Pseudomonadota bacterium]
MTDEIIPIDQKFAAAANLNKEQYAALYKESIETPEIFWAKQAERISWIKKWDKVKNTSFSPNVSIKWFEGGKLNVSVNCIDRHLPELANKTAIIWEGDNPAESRHISYQELHDYVCRLANVLLANGIKKGDRVTIYLPMIPEAAFAMLACARIGAIHSVVFAGFSAESLSGRIIDCQSNFIITADESVRAGKKIALKDNVDAAIVNNKEIKKVLVVRHTGGVISWNNARDIWYHDEIAKVSNKNEPAIMDSEDALFILYTSGSTGKPKGLLHTSGGYLLYASLTHKLVFDYKKGEVFWCTADIGWITGHSYVLYGPLCNGATTLMFEGVPSYPDYSRFWSIIDKHDVNIFYTAPTAIRALMREGDEFVTRASRNSLRLLGSVGEPINPEAWLWYYNIVGERRCPIIDTWWQTETGGIMISPLAGAMDLKPGSAGLPFFGVQPVILDNNGNVLEGECEGLLCLADSTPAQARSIYGDNKRFEETYFTSFPGYYFTGDGAKRDKDGYYWITGRVDDVINVSGHRLGTAEIESALVAHELVAEAAAVGFPHDIKGQGIYVYVTLIATATASSQLEAELIKWVRTKISPIATPDKIHFTSSLPKTRSGKIMRRILRKIAEGDIAAIGDISTLSNPDIVSELLASKKI